MDMPNTPNTPNAPPDKPADKPAENPAAATAALPPPLASRADFEAAVRWAVTGAAARGARRLLFVDADFADWPLDDAVLQDNLAAWLRLPQRQLLLLAGDFDGLPRSRPRFDAWRRPWVHAMEAWAPVEPTELPTLLLDDGELCLQLTDKRQWRGAVTRDARLARQWREHIDAILQRSAPAFPATTVGL